MLTFRRGCLILGLLSAIALTNSQAHAQTAFTYQGSLDSLSSPAIGQYDFKFRLYDAQTAGNPVGAEQAYFSINVIDGLFSLPIDFGPVFDGTSHWLEISVRTAGSGSYTVLSPRQMISPAPEAIFAQQADTAKVATTATAALNGVPSGFAILGTSSVPPPGYTWTSQMLGNPPQWETLPALPSGLFSPNGALLGENFYVTANNDFVKYDTVTSTWALLPDVPTSRGAYGSIVAANGKIYVLGGNAAPLPGGVSTNEMYDPLTNTWSTKASMPIATYSGDACAIGRLIYYFDFQGTQVYDTVTDTWALKEEPPSAISQFFDIAVYNGKCYFFGGNGAVHMVYDPNNDDGPGGQTAWSTVPQMPTVLVSVVSVTYNGKIYCLGGNSGTGSVATVQVFDPQTDTWEAGTAMLNARNSFAADADETGIYVAGGLAGTWLTNVEKYSGAQYYVHVKD